MYNTFSIKVRNILHHYYRSILGDEKLALQNPDISKATEACVLNDDRALNKIWNVAL